MSATFDNLGIRFLYPENWRLRQQQSGDIPCEISVETPDSGFWSVYVYRDSADPEQLAAKTVETMQSEYEDLEYEAIVEPVDDLEAAGYEMHFYCLDFLITARVLGFRCGGYTFLVMYQAESREFDAQQRVFQAVTVSLRRGSKP